MLLNKDHPDAGLFYYSDHSPRTSHKPRTTTGLTVKVDSLTDLINCKTK